MTQKQFNESFKKVFNSEELKALLESGADREKISSLFAENGIVIPIEHVQDVFNQLKYSVAGSDELDEDALENVAGGSMKDILKWGKDAIKFMNDCKPDGKYGNVIQKGFDFVYKFGRSKGWWK